MVRAKRGVANRAEFRRTLVFCAGTLQASGGRSSLVAGFHLTVEMAVVGHSDVRTCFDGQQMAAEKGALRPLAGSTIGNYWYHRSDALFSPCPTLSPSDQNNTQSDVAALDREDLRAYGGKPPQT